MGHVFLLNMDGKELWNLRMHKKKVTHVALNPSCDWLLATASVDQTVKIWDLRQVRGKASFLCSLPHKHPVNSGVTPQTSPFRTPHLSEHSRGLLGGLEAARPTLSPQCLRPFLALAVPVGY